MSCSVQRVENDSVALSIVSPFYNECEIVLEFMTELRSVLDHLDLPYEVIMVDDGSSDGSFDLVASFDWKQLKVVRLVRNVGHQTALEVGTRESKGRYVVTMDSDLQHPPDIIPRLLAAAEMTGVDVVYAVRSARDEDPAFKRLSAHTYYRLMRLVTGVPVEDSAADFRLMSRFAVNIVNGMPERKVYRLLLPVLGFASTTVPYTAGKRQAGESKYTFRKMVSLAMLSSVQFSRHPLRVVAGFGVVSAAIAFAWLGYVIISFLNGNTSVGWPSLMVVVLLLGGLTLFSLGVIGEYVGEIFEMTKRRPLYLIREIRNSGNMENRDSD